MLKEFYQENIKKWVRPVDRIDCSEAATNLVLNHGKTKVIPLLWENNHAAWFLMRSLSMTSSTVHNLIAYLSTLSEAGRQEIGMPNYEFQILMDYLGNPSDAILPEGTAHLSEEELEMTVAMLQNDESLVEQLKTAYEAKELSPSS